MNTYPQPNYKKAIKDIASIVQALESAPEQHLVEIVKLHSIPTIKRIIAEAGIGKQSFWGRLKQFFNHKGTTS